MWTSSVNSLRGRHSHKPVTAAICHKTLFGAHMNLTMVDAWVDYNLRLGFDHVYVWFMPEMRNYTGFDALAANPRLTLIENRQAHEVPLDDKETVIVGPLDQQAIERVCLKMTKRNYSWVMLADVDEYLRFNTHQTLKDFLRKHHSYNYLSLGKQVYTLTDKVAGDNSLSSYPFHAGPFCLSHFNKHNKNKTDTYSRWWRAWRKRRDWRERRSRSYCPTWLGRSKTIVRPSHHKYVLIHGYKQHLYRALGQKHFDTSEAHFMEWSHLFDTYTNVRVRAPRDYVVSSQDEVSIHDLDEAHRPNANGTWPIYHDPTVKPWFDYVNSLSIGGN
jgi:Glycosyltransferase family 92